MVDRLQNRKIIFIGIFSRFKFVFKAVMSFTWHMDWVWFFLDDMNWYWHLNVFFDWVGLWYSDMFHNWIWLQFPEQIFLMRNLSRAFKIMRTYLWNWHWHLVFNVFDAVCMCCWLNIGCVSNMCDWCMSYK